MRDASRGGVPHLSRNKQFSVPIKPFSAWGIWGRLIVYGGIRLRILDVSIWKISLFLLASAFLPMSSKIQHIFKIRYHIQLTGKKTLTPRFKGIMKTHLTKSDTYIMFANLLLTSALFRHEDTEMTPRCWIFTKYSESVWYCDMVQIWTFLASIWRCKGKSYLSSTNPLYFTLYPQHPKVGQNFYNWIILKVTKAQAFGLRHSFYGINGIPPGRPSLCGALIPLIQGG